MNDCCCVGQAFFNAQLVLQKNVYGIYDKLDDGEWGIPYAEVLSVCRIKCFQKVFIEVYQWVSVVSDVSFEHFLQIGGTEHLNQVVDNPGDALMDCITSQVVEDSS